MIEFDSATSTAAIKQSIIMEQACVVADQLVAIAEQLQSNKTLSAESSSILRMATEQAYQILGVSAPASFAMESFNETRTALAVENLLEDIMDIVKSLGSKVSWFFKKDVDDLEAFYTFWEGQTDKLHRVDAKINAYHETNGVFRTTETKYVRYGANINVKNFPEYAEKYQRMAEVMVAANNALVKLKDKDWLQSFKVFFSPLTGYDDKYIEQWTNLNDFVTTIAKAVNCKPRSHGGEFITMHSETMLGMSHFEAKMPEKNTYDIRFADSLKKVHKHMWMEFTRDEKFELGSMSANVVLDKVNKRDLQRCANASYDIIASYKELMSIRNKLSSYGEAYVLSDAIFSAVYPLAWWKALLANYRIMVRVSTMQYFITGSMFNFSRGNVAKFMNIVDKNI